MWSSEDEGAPQMTRVVDALDDHLDDVIGDKEEPVRDDAVVSVNFKKMVKLIKVESVTGIKANFADPSHALDEIIHRVTEEQSEDALTKLKIAYCQLIEERDELHTKIKLLETSLKGEKLKSNECLSLVNELETDVERLKNCNQQLREYYEEKSVIAKSKSVDGNSSQLKELYFFLNLENAKLIKKNEDLIHDFVEAENKIHDLENGKYFYRPSSNIFDEPNYPDFSVPPPNINRKNEMPLPGLASPSYEPGTVQHETSLAASPTPSHTPRIVQDESILTVSPTPSHKPRIVQDGASLTVPPTPSHTSRILQDETILTVSPIPFHTPRIVQDETILTVSPTLSHMTGIVQDETILAASPTPSYTPGTVKDESILSVCPLDSPIPDINVPLIFPTVLPINSHLETYPSREAEEKQLRAIQQPKDYDLAHNSGSYDSSDKNVDVTKNDEENDPQLTNKYVEKLEPVHSSNSPELAGHADKITKPEDHYQEDFNLTDHGDKEYSKPATCIVSSNPEILPLPPAFKSTQTDLFDLRNNRTNASDLKNDDNNNDMPKCCEFADEADGNLKVSMKQTNIPTIVDDPSKVQTFSSDFLQEFIADLDDHTPPFIQKLLQDYATPPDSPARLVNSLPNYFPTPGEDTNSLRGFKSDEMLLIEQLQAMGFSLWTLAASVKSCGVDVNKVIHRCLVLDMLVAEGNSVKDVLEVVEHYKHLEASEDTCRWHLNSFKRLRDVGFNNKDIHEALLRYPADYKAALEHLIQWLV